MIKIHQNKKSEKMQKIKNHQKWQKPENEKTQKQQNQKSENHEKVSKNDPPLKMAKMSDKWPKVTLCEIRAAWLGTFSIPGGTTGPGFKAEIRPPLFLHIFDQFLSFFTFSFCHFFTFYDFYILMKLPFLIKWPFFDHISCNVIRPYSD